MRRSSCKLVRGVVQVRRIENEYLRQGHRKRGIGRKIELGVTLALGIVRIVPPMIPASPYPIFYNGNVDGSKRGRPCCVCHSDKVVCFALELRKWDDFQAQQMWSECQRGAILSALTNPAPVQDNMFLRLRGRLDAQIFKIHALYCICARGTILLITQSTYPTWISECRGLLLIPKAGTACDLATCVAEHCSLDYLLDHVQSHLSHSTVKTLYVPGARDARFHIRSYRLRAPTRHP